MLAIVSRQHDALMNRGGAANIRKESLLVKSIRGARVQFTTILLCRRQQKG